MKNRDRTKQDKAAVLAVVQAAPAGIFTEGLRALLAASGIPEARAKHALRLSIRIGDILEDAHTHNFLISDRVKAVAGFNAFPKQRRAPAAKTRPDQYADNMRRTRAAELAAFDRMQATRPLKPPPFTFGPRRLRTPGEIDAQKAATRGPQVGFTAVMWGNRRNR